MRTLQGDKAKHVEVTYARPCIRRLNENANAKYSEAKAAKALISMPKRHSRQSDLQAPYERCSSYIWWSSVCKREFEYTKVKCAIVHLHILNQTTIRALMKTKHLHTRKRTMLKLQMQTALVYATSNSSIQKPSTSKLKVWRRV